jgi:hypothetical protein
MAVIASPRAVDGVRLITYPRGLDYVDPEKWAVMPCVSSHLGQSHGGNNTVLTIVKFGGPTRRLGDGANER